MGSQFSKRYLASWLQRRTLPLQIAELAVVELVNSGVNALLLGFHLLEEHILLGMGLSGDGIQRIRWVRDLVAGISPSHIDRPVDGKDALVVAQTVTDEAVVVSRPEGRCVTERNVGGRQPSARSLGSNWKAALMRSRSSVSWAP